MIGVTRIISGGCGRGLTRRPSGEITMETNSAVLILSSRLLFGQWNASVLSTRTTMTTWDGRSFWRMLGWIGAWLMKSWTQNMRLPDGREKVAPSCRNLFLPIAELYVLFDGRVTGGRRKSLLRKCSSWNLATQALCLPLNSLNCRYTLQHHAIERLGFKVMMLRSNPERSSPIPRPTNIVTSCKVDLDGRRSHSSVIDGMRWVLANGSFFLG